jgi:hypothetical protein
MTHENKDGVHLVEDIPLPLLIDDLGPFPVVLPGGLGVGIWEYRTRGQAVRLGFALYSPPIAGMAPLHG